MAFPTEPEAISEADLPHAVVSTKIPPSTKRYNSLFIIPPPKQLSNLETLTQNTVSRLASYNIRYLEHFGKKFSSKFARKNRQTL